MKKITLLLIMVLITYGISAQQTISFEASEGYTLGSINAQNNWVSSGNGSGGFVTNQVISDEQASDGIFSLKINYEPTLPGQAPQIAGGLFNLTTAQPFANAVFSADMYIDTPNPPSTPDYDFRLVNTTNDSRITAVSFQSNGDILVLSNVPGFGIVLVDTMQNWTSLSWFNVRIELTSNNVEVFINDISIFTGLVAEPDLDIEQVGFIQENFNGFAFIDNFRIDNNPLSTFDFGTSKVNYFVDSQNILNLSANNLLNDLKIYNTLGQEILNKNLENLTETIDVNELNSGVYIANVKAGNAIETFKFVKK